ncbi:MAG TPA: PDZ domain-containing protein, partial [Candidatus Polarisedimenticolia bacterium]|nr:PDZ domain-containing protein [Candidatus Polarisedimenticolia bacterium]
EASSGQKRAGRGEAFPALAELERELQRLVDAASPSVVRIVARTDLKRLLHGMGEEIRIEIARGSEPAVARRIGSGVVIDASGHIATVSSVVSGASDIVVMTAGGEELRARLQGIDVYSGLAVLQVDAPFRLPPLRLAEPDSLREGALVTAMGSQESGSPTYSVGVLSGRGTSFGPLRRGPYLKLTASVTPGAGGGPVLDTSGALVGVVFGAGGPQNRRGDSLIVWEEAPRARRAPEEPGDPEIPDPPDDEDELDADDRAQLALSRAYLRSLHRAGAAGSGISYAVPVDVVRRVTSQLIRAGVVERGWLGVTIESAGSGQVEITRIHEGSPAQRAGLRPGDRIMRLDGAEVTAAEQLAEYVSMADPGTRLSLDVEREGRTRSLTLQLMTRPQPPRPPEPPAVLLRAPAPRPRTRQLGVILEQPDDATRARLGSLPGVGLIVRVVNPGSAARRAGIRTGDLIVEIEDAPIRTLVDLRRALRDSGPSEELRIVVLRSGGKLALRLPADAGSITPAPPAPPAHPAPLPRR